uniref:hypothetical protein n=1 Tax=Limnohabitans sp. TaxID=1907725 RepID=UPI004047D373
MKTTQLSYPNPQQLAEIGSAHSKSSAPILNSLRLLEGAKKPNAELHHLRDGCVVLFKRDRSEVWQVRFKLFDMKWRRFTTKHRELAYAKKVAAEMYDRARFKEEMGIPLSTKRFGVVAEECLTMLEREIEQGLRPMTNKDYQRVIRRYLIPFFGKYNLTSLDSNLVREFEIWRNWVFRSNVTSDSGRT